MIYDLVPVVFRYVMWIWVPGQLRDNPQNSNPKRMYLNRTITCHPKSLTFTPPAAAAVVVIVVCAVICVFLCDFLLDNCFAFKSHLQQKGKNIKATITLETSSRNKNWKPLKRGIPFSLQIGHHHLLLLLFPQHPAPSDIHPRSLIVYLHSIRSY